MTSASGTAPQVPKPRIQDLSDLVFGLALSVGALQFIGNLPQTHNDLVTDLSSFAFSFLVLISLWDRYTATMSVMPVETPLLVRLNMILLFLVVVEPFLFNILAVRGLGSAIAAEVSEYYALDLAGMNLILAYFTQVLASEEKHLIPSNLIRPFKVVRNLQLLSAAVFALSDIPLFWSITVGGIPLRIILWVLTIPVVWLSRLFSETSRPEQLLRPERHSEPSS